MGFQAETEVAYGLPPIAFETLRRQVAGAVAKGAAAVLDEAPSTTNHEERVTWAREAQVDTLGMATRMLHSVMLNPTIAADPGNATDNDVEYVVNGLIDDFANATG